MFPTVLWLPAIGPSFSLTIDFFGSGVPRLGVPIWAVQNRLCVYVQFMTDDALVRSLVRTAVKLKTANVERIREHLVQVRFGYV